MGMEIAREVFDPGLTVREVFTNTPGVDKTVCAETEDDWDPFTSSNRGVSIWA